MPPLFLIEAVCEIVKKYFTDADLEDLIFVPIPDDSLHYTMIQHEDGTQEKINIIKFRLRTNTSLSEFRLGYCKRNSTLLYTELKEIYRHD